MKISKSNLRRWMLRGGRSLNIAPPATRGLTAPPDGGVTAHQGNGRGNAVDGGTATANMESAPVVPEENHEPLRRRIWKRGRQSRLIRWGARVYRWLYIRWPWRERTPEEIAALEEAKRRKRLEKLLRKEARLAMRYMRDALDRRGLCYSVVRDGRRQIRRSVRFSLAVMQPDALYIRVDTRRLPYGVGVLDLVDESILADLSYAVGRRVSAYYNEEKGLWYVIERASGVRGVPRYVPYQEMMDRMPANADALTIPLGKAENSRPMYYSLAQMPHLLVAGATDTGKSNMLNSIICTLLLRNQPRQLQLLLVDLKGGMEFALYEGVPHLMRMDGITDSGIIYDRERVLDALEWLIKVGEKRMELLKQRGYRNIGAYNARHKKSKLHRIVFIVDEWADIKLVPGLGRRAETLLANVASRMRAVGIHVIVATQVPKKEVISTLIKTNLPARMCFSVPSATASILVIDSGDARGLEPQGRFVFQKGARLLHIQAPHIPDVLVKRIVSQVSGGAKDIEIKSREPTIEEVLEWALKHNGGELQVHQVYAAFSERVPRSYISGLLKDAEGREFDVAGVVYRVIPGSGTIPRRAVMVE